MLKTENSIIIDKSQIYDSEFKRTTWNINQVVLGMTDIEGEYVKYPDDLEIIGTIHKLIINDNPFVYTQELREEYIQAIYNQVNNFGYEAFSTKWEGLPYVEIGDSLNIDGHDSICLRYNIKSPNGLDSTLEAPSIIDSVINYVKNSDTIDKKIRNTQIIVNKQEGIINWLTDTTETLSDELENNYYNIEETNHLIQESATGLTNIFTQSGGFNLLRETAPYTINSNGTIPYWEGNIGRIKDEDYSSGYALLLQNGIVKQTVVLKNNIYSLGFKYKKLIPNSLCIAKYNGREIALTEDDGEISTTGEVTAGSITIEFDCDTENGFSIGELMLNIGEVLSSWSQNQNESHSDTVNISDGITVSSSSSNTDAKMDADGFRVVAKGSGENTLKATDDGVETPEIKAERGEIANLIIQKIGDEIWITGGGS